MKQYLLSASLLCIFAANSQSFTPITQSITNTFEFTEISEANNVAIIGGDYVSKSVDGGFTWTEMPLGTEGLPWVTYEFVGGTVLDPLTYVIIGKDFLNYRSKILRTIDGGNTWTNVYETALNSYSYFTHIIYNGNAVVVAAEDGVLRSTDQGLNWSFVPVNNGYMNALNYNTSTNSILANYSSSGTFRESTTDGASWTFISLPSILGGYTHITNQNNNYFITQSSAASKNWFTVDATNTCIDTTTSTSDLFPNSVEQSFLLPNGRIISRVNNSGGVYNIDPTNGNTFIYDYYMQEPGGLYVDITFMDIDQTYGLLVGEMGAVTRFDLSSPADIHLPSSFNLVNAQCPGNTITADADYTYADSTVWYYDGNQIAADTSISYVTPPNFGSFDLVMQNWVNGDYTADTVVLTYTPPAPTPQYTTSMNDSTPCFNSAVYFTASYNSGAVNGSTIEIWQGNSLIYGPNSAGTGNVSLWTAPVTTDDTLYTIITRPQTCGTTYDTIVNIIYAGDYLSDNYTLLTTDSVLCSGEYAQFQLVNTDSSMTYDFEMTNTYNGNTWSSTYQGVNNDTLLIQGQVYNTANNYSVTDDVYSYYTLSISDTNGCSESFHPFDTIIVIRPTSIFYSHSQNYFRNDTVILSNAYVKENRIWDVTPNGLTLQNNTDTIPIIYGDTLGFYDLSLTNTPLPTCSDELVRTIQYCDTLPVDPTTLCWEQEDGNYRNLSRLEMDQYGNVYELGVFKAYPNAGSQTPRPGYHLVKRDPYGNVLWEKKADASQFDFYVDGVVIEAIDIDANGDVICGMWIQSEHTYNQELINYDDISFANEIRLYVLKLDGTNGDMIWVKDLTDTGLEFANTNNSTRFRISDILVNNQRIYVGVTASKKLMMLALDLQGNYLSSEKIEGSQFYTPNSYHMYNGSNGDDRESFLFFRFEEYSTGEIACAAYYSGTPVYGGSAMYSIASPQIDALMVMKYTEDDGFYAFEKVSRGLNNQILSVKDNTPLFVLDDDDNMTIALSWANSALPPLERDTVWIKDSSFVSIGASFVFQLDTAFNLNWVSTGNYTNILDIDIARSTGDIFVSGKATYNVGFGTVDKHMMIGGYGNYPNEPGTIPFYWTLENDFILTDDPFHFRFNSDGEPLSGRFYEVSEPNLNTHHPLQIKNLVTPCGEMITYLNRNYAITVDSLDINQNGVEFDVDSLYIRKYGFNCTQETCEYLQLNQDTVYYCSGSNIASIDCYSVFNVDSISYDLLDNGTSVLIDSVPLVNGSFNIALPYTSNNFSVAITYPISDTIVLTEIVPTLGANNFTYDSIGCIGTSQTVTANSTDYQYVWFDTIIGQTLNLSTDTSGVFEIPVLSTNVYGCSIEDTLEIEILEVITPTFDTLFNVSCDTLLVIPFNDGDYINESWVLNGSPSTNNFSLANLSLGFNNVEVELTDTNNCVVNYPLTINYTASIYPTIDSNYVLYCHDTLVVTYNSGAFVSESWTLNGSPATNSFYGSILDDNPNTNLVIAELLDTNGCITNFPINMIYFPPVAPTFASSYSVACDEQLVIQFNSGLYNVQNWTLNGSPASNNFSSSNLNIGLNQVIVELTDYNGCTETYEIEIDYCYDLGVVINESKDLLVTPNPFGTYFKLNFEENKSIDVILYDVSGKLVLNQKNVQSGDIINTEALNSGVYVLRFYGLMDASPIRIVKF